MKIHIFISVLLLYFSAACVFAGGNIIGEGESFAQEYATLNLLLKKVQSRESALLYKYNISKELERIKSSQISGGKVFSTLSDKQQQAFIKKFQNNKFHCGEVTQVMEERNRILLNPELNEVLSSVINDIP